MGKKVRLRHLCGWGALGLSHTSNRTGKPWGQVYTDGGGLRGALS